MNNIYIYIYRKLEEIFDLIWTIDPCFTKIFYICDIELTAAFNTHDELRIYSQFWNQFNNCPREYQRFFIGATTHPHKVEVFTRRRYLSQLYINK